MHVITCTILILLVSWGYTYYTFATHGMLKYFNYVMFLPAPLALVFSYLEYKSVKKVFDPVLTIPSAKSVFFSIFYPLLFLIVCGLIAVVIGIGELNSSSAAKLFKLHTLSNFIFALLVLFGEEFAWRGYLLPSFKKKWGIVPAVLIVGFVWAIWHGPMMYGLAGVMKTSTSPALLCLIQMGAVMVFSFPFAYCYLISGSIVPPMIFHYVWNWMNPVILGNIYRNKPGIIEGNIVYINGEGVMGVLVGLLFIVWFLKKSKVIDHD